MSARGGATALAAGLRTSRGRSAARGRAAGTVALALAAAAALAGPARAQAPTPVPVTIAVALAGGSLPLGSWAVRRLHPRRDTRDHGPGLRETLAACPRDCGAPRRALDRDLSAPADDPLAALGWYGAQPVRIARLPRRRRVPELPAAGIGRGTLTGSAVDPARAAVARPPGGGSGTGPAEARG